MERFKVENYERDHGAGIFLRFRQLSKEESLAVVQKIWMSLKLQGEVDKLQLETAIWKAAAPVLELGDAYERFRPDELLTRLGFGVNGSVFLDWRCFDGIDEVLTNDFCSQFSDICDPAWGACPARS